MGKDKKSMELAPSAINPFSPRIEGEASSNTEDSWWRTDHLGLFKGDKLISTKAPIEAIGEIKEVIEASKELIAVQHGNDVYLLPESEKPPVVIFEESYQWTIDVDKISSIDDIKHIIGLLDIKMDKVVASKLPLHLVKPI